MKVITVKPVEEPESAEMVPISLDAPYFNVYRRTGVGCTGHFMVGHTSKEQADSSRYEREGMRRVALIEIRRVALIKIDLSSILVPSVRP